MNVQPVAREYQIEVDRISKAEWHDALQRFDDATLYQTWSYGAVRWGENRLSHMVIKKGEEVIGLAQLSLVKIPFLGAGIAYLPWGPVWHLSGKKCDPKNFLQIMRALQKEYVLSRRLLLRMMPNEFEGANGEVESILKKEGFQWKPNRHRTILLDLSPSLESLRKSFNGKWRNGLNRAEKNHMPWLEGIETTLYDRFCMMYREMVLRKGFNTSLDINQFQAIQKDLPDPLKMRILICLHEGKPVSGLVCSAMGERGIYLLGATSDEGMKMNGSYLLQWEILRWLKEKKKCRYYDLGGIDPEGNYGVYHFKSGLGGKEIFHIGQFEVSQSRVSSMLVTWGEDLKNKRETANRIRNKVNERSKRLWTRR